MSATKKRYGSVKWIMAFSIIICMAFLFGGCNQMAVQEKKDGDLTIKDIAYDITGKEDCMIYIEENGSFIPYLVISSDYAGSTLILRKDLLDNTMPFNKNETHMWANYEYGGYYEDSSIDNYLNIEFVDMLNHLVKDFIVESNIVITDKSSLGVTGKTTKTISRKVFILSLKELNGAESSASVSEGNTLKFFADDYNRRVANLPNGEKSAYWARTPETWETYTVFTIGSGGTGSGSADIDSGVRPAFCLPKNTVIHRGSVNGEDVYMVQ